MSTMPPPSPPVNPSRSPEPSSQPPPAPRGQAYLNPQAMTGWANLGTGGTVELASPGARLGARVLDVAIMLSLVFLLLIGGVLGIVAVMESGDENDLALVGGVIIIMMILAMPVFVVVGIAYEVTLIAVKGQTLGKMLANIKVVRADNGFTPGWGKSIGRWILPIALNIVPFLGLLAYVSLTWDRVRQGWHDKAAATLVVKT